jgi:hypothetical protein
MAAELPPAIAFMLSEFPGKDLALADVHKELSDRSFVKDFFDQCLAGSGTFKYGESLDPLSPDGKCRELECRVAYAHQFARTACLYADRVVISDPFSFILDATDEDITINATRGRPRRVQIDDRVGAAKLVQTAVDEHIFLCLVVLKILKPLLEAGIIVFGPAAYPSCSNCMKAVTAAEKQVSSLPSQ